MISSVRFKILFLRNGWSNFQSLFLNVPHSFLNTLSESFKPNKLILLAYSVDGVYLELNNEHFGKKRLEIGPTISEIYDFKVDTLKS